MEERLSPALPQSFRQQTLPGPSWANSTDMRPSNQAYLDQITDICTWIVGINCLQEHPTNRQDRQLVEVREDLDQALHSTIEWRMSNVHFDRSQDQAVEQPFVEDNEGEEEEEQGDGDDDEESATREIRGMLDQWTIGDQYRSTGEEDRERSDSQDSGIVQDEDPLGPRDSVTNMPAPSFRQEGPPVAAPSHYARDCIEDAEMCGAQRNLVCSLSNC